MPILSFLYYCFIFIAILGSCVSFGAFVFLLFTSSVLALLFFIAALTSIAILFLFAAAIKEILTLNDKIEKMNFRIDILKKQNLYLRNKVEPEYQEQDTIETTTEQTT